MNYQSDYGYLTGAISMSCCACGSTTLYCCDGHGRRLSFDAWGKAVDAEICKINETERNEVEAAYAEMYLEGLSVMAAVDRAAR
jgi:hypothetical protein